MWCWFGIEDISVNLWFSVYICRYRNAYKCRGVCVCVCVCSTHIHQFFSLKGSGSNTPIAMSTLILCAPISCLLMTTLHQKNSKLFAAAAKSLQSYPTRCDPIDGSPPGSLSLGFSRQEHWSGLPFPSPMHESEK